FYLIKTEIMGRLEGKVALITGASRGIGRVEAILFAKEGASVIVADVLTKEGEKVVEEIKATGGKAEFTKLDVTIPEEWQRVVDEVIKKHGKVDILVNNAGILISKTTEELTPEDWNRILDVNVKGTFWGCKYILPAMKKANRGSIINTSSIAGIVAFPEPEPAYDTSKGAVRMLTKAVAVNYAKYNIRVNSLHPGNTRTEMNEPWLKDPEKAKILTEPALLKRVAEPIEIAYGALFLASDESSFITGAELVVDGGYTAI
ncbi:MAG: SDR family NAD(P)-dependent oxidoreductase, partial [Candidatus Hadarchaeaceae archaeon]